MAALVIGLVLTGFVGSARAGVPAEARVAFRLHDPRIDEASGIGVGIRSPHVVYVQNDSGDSARFFALDRSTGRTLAVFAVPGAVNVDWEDLAVARDARGVASIWLADTGDNNARRPEVRVYRVDEPAVTVGGAPTRSTHRPDVWRLRYPGGPVNVEALAVAPGGAMTLATKSPAGDTVLYAVPAASDAPAVRVLRRIASFQVPQSDGPLDGGSLLGLLVTGAAVSGDGRRFVLRTYTNAYVWTVHHSDIAAALHNSPERVALPDQPQGEGVSFDGANLILDSERVDSAVWVVPVPIREPGPAPAPTATTVAAPQATSRSAATKPARADRTGADGGSGRLGEFAALGAAAAALTTAAVLIARRRNSGRRT